MSIATDVSDHFTRPAPLVAAPQSLLSAEVISPAEWETIIAGFDEVCQEQLYTFATLRWPSVRQEPVIFRMNGAVVGGSLVMIQPFPLRLGALAVAKWGPMLARADHPRAAEIYRAMIDALIAEYADKRRLMLSVLPRASLTAANAEYEHLMARGFSRGSELAFPNRYIVNLRLSDAEQRKSFLQKWRYHLNKADKAGLSFERGEASRIGEFGALYERMLDRKKFPDHSAYETVPGLMAMQNDVLRPEVFFVRHGGEVIGGALIFKAGDRAVYLYGATSDKALPLRAGYFMHWHIIRWLRDNTSARWYDLGGTDGFQGLHQFKKGMVGEAGVISPVPPVANYASYWWPRTIGNAAFAARETLQRMMHFVNQLRGDRAKPDQKRDESEAGE